MAKKITDNRLEKLEMSSTDQDDYRIIIDWSTDGGSSTDYGDDVILVNWSDVDYD